MRVPSRPPILLRPACGHVSTKANQGLVRAKSRRDPKHQQKRLSQAGHTLRSMSCGAGWLVSPIRAGVLERTNPSPWPKTPWIARNQQSPLAPDATPLANLADGHLFPLPGRCREEREREAGRRRVGCNVGQGGIDKEKGRNMNQRVGLQAMHAHGHPRPWVRQEEDG